MIESNDCLPPPTLGEDLGGGYLRSSLKKRSLFVILCVTRNLNSKPLGGTGEISVKALPVRHFERYPECN
jgi:hypothetical protein